MSLALRRPSLGIGFATASLSGALILVHAAGWVTLSYSVRIAAPLALLLFISLLVLSGRAREDVLLTRLTGGLIAGALGLVAYDVVRLAFLFSGLVPINPFRPIEIYGLLILGASQDTAITRTVGWAFHIWNGLSFAVMYTLALGRGRILWGLGWGMLLELAMVLSYPSIFRLMIDWRFLMVSIAGHTAYGLTLGWTARRTVHI
jgi:hypothetical protein